MRIIAVLCLFGLVAGCSVTSSSNNPVMRDSTQQNSFELTSDFSRSKLIAADFVATIAQIPATDPATTIMHTSKPTTRFGELLLSSLQKAGFDLRIGTETSDFLLEYNAVRDEQLSVDGNPVYTFLVAAGEVKLKRSYEVDRYGVRPTGGMFVRGASINDVVSDDSMFSIRKPRPKPKPETVPAATIADLNSDGVSINAIPASKPFVKSKKMFSADEKLKMQQRRDLEESVAALAPLNDLTELVDYSQMRNMFDTKTSQYQDVFKDYEVVNTAVLVFPDDSLLLGKLNKRSIIEYASVFNPETDVMSVIGCSHGPTQLNDGNAFLANNRAFRVKEEFLAAGIEPGKVLEEGCWAGTHFDKMPARGVLLQHKRLSKNQ